jgi:serine/threonine-protein kinase
MTINSSCPGCKKSIQADWKVCPDCRYQLIKEKPTCPHCKYEVEANWKACPNCKRLLGKWVWLDPLLSFWRVIRIPAALALVALILWLIISVSSSLASSLYFSVYNAVSVTSRVSATDGMTQVYVPAGSFTMGSDSGSSNEKPAHAVTLNAFWIDQTEVTNAMYALCVKAGKCPQPSSLESYKRDRYYGNSGFDNYPVIYVSWDNANAYCKWANRRLPSEAEWEKAARGADGRIYPWGNAFDAARLNSYEGKAGDTTEVGKYPGGVSPYGALDMAGNVWEWVNDWYDETYYSKSPPQNPTGPTSGQYRVLRGGAWYNSDDDARVSYRNGNDPSYSYDALGFRCVSSP